MENFKVVKVPHHEKYNYFDILLSKKFGYQQNYFMVDDNDIISFIDGCLYIGVSSQCVKESFDNVYIYLFSDDKLEIGDWVLGLDEKPFLLKDESDIEKYSEFRKIIKTNDLDIIKYVNGLLDEYIDNKQYTQRVKELEIIEFDIMELGKFIETYNNKRVEFLNTFIH